MLKKVVGGVVIAAILGCLASAAARSPFFYMVSFIVLVQVVFFALWMRAKNFGSMLSLPSA